MLVGLLACWFLERCLAYATAPAAIGLEFHLPPAAPPEVEAPLSIANETVGGLS